MSHRVGEVYRRIERFDYTEIETFLYRRQIMEAGVLTPVLLWLFSSDVPPYLQIKKGIHALESYLVRRMVCRMTTMGYSWLFRNLVNSLIDSDHTEAGDVIVKYLEEQTANQRLWPNDLQVEDTFLREPLYSTMRRARLRIVLEGIETELRTNKTESVSVPRNLTIEHIMPVTWRQHWKPPINMQNDPRVLAERDRLVHSIGNLTLVNRRLNADLSNAPWRDEQLALHEHSLLFLNKTLLDNAPDVWDEAAIMDRARRLCQAAIKIWPHADGIR